jgi:EAL domain-containing protein (putative c-di-GMP-specific phosphodiesterase class I)/GGDEF domain-containing protein
MTMARQLLSILSVVFLIIFGGNFWLNLNTLQDYMRLQLESHAQDTATSLGVSLRPFLSQKDLPAMNSLVDVVFDRGYYQEITLEDIHGKPMLQRNTPVVVRNVPEWFINIFPLEGPRSSTALTSGWNNAGTLWVRSHPGYAYAQMWKNAISSAKQTAIIYLLTVIAFALTLRFLLKPLRDVEAQAQAISNQHFKVLDYLPRTRELARVVQAMNEMSVRIERTLRELTHYADHLRYEAYSDSATGLNNLRRFEAAFARVLSGTEAGLHGAVAHLRIHDLLGYYQQHGQEIGDKLLQETAALVELCCEPYESALPARIGQADFAILLPNSNAHEAAALGGALSEGLQRIRISRLDGCIGHIGIACYHGGDSANSVMSAAQNALMHATQHGPNGWHLAETRNNLATPNSLDAQRILADVISDRAIRLVEQQVKHCNSSDILYNEFLARIETPNGEMVSVGAVLPVAKKLGVIQDFERMVVEKAFEYMDGSPNSQKCIAVNLSFQSLHDGRFMHWLLTTLKEKPLHAKRLIIELSEHEIELDLETSQRVADRCHEIGANIAIQHFGITFLGFGYLRNMKPNYIKVDGSYIRGIAQDRDNRSYLHTLVGIAHGLDIKVIAECTESEADRQALSHLNVDGVQGYYVSPPRAISMLPPAAGATG